MKTSTARAFRRNSSFISFAAAFGLATLGARTAGAQAHSILVNHNGPVMNNVQIYPLFYGAGWTGGPSGNMTLRTAYLQTLTSYINGFNAPAGNAKPTIRQYGVVGATLHPAVQAGQSVAAHNMLDAEIRNAIHASQPGQVPAYSSNVLIFIFLGPGFTQGSGSCGSYHSSESNTAFYAITPECGGLDVIGHEVSEAATDPVVGAGWDGADNSEMEDGCTQGGTYTSAGTTISVGGADNTQAACSTTGYYNVPLSGRGNILLTGPSTWNTVPVAFNTNTLGSFTTTNLANVMLSSFASTAGSKVASGDFNSDGITDLIAIKPNSTTLLTGFGMGDGSFVDVTNVNDSFVTSNAVMANVNVVSGDFNGDGYTDLAMMGNSTWTTIPVAFSNGDGTFTTTNFTNTFWAANAAAPGVKFVTGRFNGDNRDDIAMMGNSSWTTVPVAFSNGDGTFTTTNFTNTFVASNAAMSGVQVVSGDFDGNGRTDLAMMGNSTWTTVPVAFSNGDGTFTTTNVTNTWWATNAASSGVKIVNLHFDGNGSKACMAMMGNASWNTVPVACSNGDGSFNTANVVNSFWSTVAKDSGAKALGARDHASP